MDSYLELAMNGPLDVETRENLSQSHAASKSLLFTINDLLDLTRLESGNETSFNEPFDLQQSIEEATQLYRNEARRRGIVFDLDLTTCPKQVIGDARKIRTLVANLTANALKYTAQGSIHVSCRQFEEPLGLRNTGDIAVEVVVADTGCGIATEKLESIFREFEQVESAPPRTHSPGLGLGLAVVARIVEQLGGQLRVDSALGKGSRFSFLLPLATESSSAFSGSAGTGHLSITSNNSSRSRSIRSSLSRENSRGSEIDNLVEALSSSHLEGASPRQVERGSPAPVVGRPNSKGRMDIPGSANPIKPVKVDEFDLDKPVVRQKQSRSKVSPNKRHSDVAHLPKLRILIVEVRAFDLLLRVVLIEVQDNDINRMILAKRLSLDGHMVVNTSNGLEGLEVVEADRNFDCVLMDIQYVLASPLLVTFRSYS